MKNTERVAFNDSGIVATDELLDLVVTTEAETTKAIYRIKDKIN
ncbi:MAG TPA: hypothetical protein DCO67_03430 [Staphylococcus sp.]|nr:hypothetical protein [Staphylococcus sp.]